MWLKMINVLESLNTSDASQGQSWMPGASQEFISQRLNYINMKLWAMMLQKDLYNVSQEKNTPTQNNESYLSFTKELMPSFF